MKKKSLPLVLFAISFLQLAVTGCKTDKKEGGFHFDTMAPVISPVSNYVMLGDKYIANVYLSAYSSTMPMEMKVDSNPDQSWSYKEGKIQFEAIPDKEGPHKFKGELKIPNGDGTFREYPFETTYMVAKPVAQIVPSEILLYRGKENNLKISVPGIAADKLSVLATNCTISGKNGKYIVVPGKEDMVTITVISYVNGTGNKIGAYDYRVVELVKPSLIKVHAHF